MNKKLTIGIFTGLLTVAIAAVAVMSGFNSVEYSDSDNAAFEAAIAAKNSMLQVAVVDSESLENIETASLNNEATIQDEISDIVQEQTMPEYENYYNAAYAEQLKESRKAALENLSLDEITIDGGVCESSIVKIEDISSTEKELTTSEISYLETIYNIDGEYVVNLIFNSDTSTYRMINDEGLWKIDETLSSEKEFAPEDYESDKGTFSSFDEALEFAEQIDIDAENPF